MESRVFAATSAKKLMTLHSVGRDFRSALLLSVRIDSNVSKRSDIKYRLRISSLMESWCFRALSDINSDMSMESGEGLHDCKRVSFVDCCCRIFSFTGPNFEPS